VRRFTIGGSDYSAFVTKWPKFKRAWNDIKPGDLAIKLSNVDKTFNFFRDTPTALRSDCSVQFGVGSEFITIFSGKVDRVAFGDGPITVNISDRFKQLSQRMVGTSAVPVQYVSSNYLVSDLAWYLCTSYGGLSAVQSSSNPDIDYDSFLSWASVFSTDTVTVRAEFDGLKVNEALRILGRITESAIFISNDRISFHRYSLVESLSQEFTPANQGEFSLELRDDDIVNKQIVNFDYSTASDYFTKSVFAVNTSSVNSFGLREELEEDEKIWYVDSASALNYAQRITNFRDRPFDRIDIRVPAFGMLSEVGDSVTVVDSHLNFSAVFRVMATEVDLHTATARLELDRSQIKRGFTLDESYLDGADILS